MHDEQAEKTVDNFPRGPRRELDGLFSDTDFRGFDRSDLAQIRGCDQCNPSMINGVFCHESGCPDRWLDADGKPFPVECHECGSAFSPEDSEQEFCGESCAAIYNGWYDNDTCEFCEEDGFACRCKEN